MTSTTMNKPNLDNVATLQSSSLLSLFTVTKFGGNKKDKRASEEVTADKNAKRGSARVNKSLLSDNPHLDAINKHVNATYAVHRSMTMPWTNSGLQILPTSSLFTHKREMSGMIDEFYNLVDIFIANYADAVVEQQVILGDLFDANDYPTTEQMRAKFSMSLEYLPLPSSGDWRLDIPQAALNELAADYDAMLERSKVENAEAIWHKLHDALTHVSKTLDYSDDVAKKPSYRMTLIPNLLEIVELMGTFNLNNDSQMSAMKQQLETALRGVTTEAVKEDEYLRAQTKRELDAALAALPSLDW